MITFIRYEGMFGDEPHIAEIRWRGERRWTVDFRAHNRRTRRWEMVVSARPFTTLVAAQREARRWCE